MNEVDELPGRARVLEALDELQRELEHGVEWENDTLGRFLDAFSALLRSVETGYANAGQEVPEDPWIVVADVFRGARHYE